MKTAEEIYKQMDENMPYHIHPMVKPYILEALNVYAKEALNEAENKISDYIVYNRSSYMISDNKVCELINEVKCNLP